MRGEPEARDLPLAYRLVRGMRCLQPFSSQLLPTFRLHITALFCFNLKKCLVKTPRVGLFLMARKELLAVAQERIFVF